MNEDLRDVREQFRFLYETKENNLVIVACRGGGKTVAVLQYLLHYLLSGRPNSSAAFFSGTLKQAEATVNKTLGTLCREFPKKFMTYKKLERTYYFYVSKKDVRTIYLFGYEHPESKRGYHPDLIILDEAGIMPPSTFGTVIQPMLTSNEEGRQSKLIVIGTPKGQNQFYKLWCKGNSPNLTDWKSFTLKASTSNLLTEETLNRARQSVTPAEYSQEYECDFFASVLSGSVYGDLFNRIGVSIDDTFEYDGYLPVWTAWDFGHSNNTAIWFFQVKNDLVTYIDYYENSGCDISHYAGEVLSKKYTYASAILPWDAKQSNIRSSINLSEMLEQFGIKNIVLPKTSVTAGIEAAKLLLKSCRFNRSRCARGIEHLKNYQYRLDPAGEKTSTPLHDEHSDGADAFRYSAISKEFWRPGGTLITSQRRSYNPYFKV